MTLLDVECSASYPPCLDVILEEIRDVYTFHYHLSGSPISYETVPIRQEGSAAVTHSEASDASASIPHPTLASTYSRYTHLSLNMPVTDTHVDEFTPVPSDP